MGLVTSDDDRFVLCAVISFFSLAVPTLFCPESDQSCTLPVAFSITAVD